MTSPEIQDKLDSNSKYVSWNKVTRVLPWTGLEVESSVIFAGKSFTPRSVRLNLTANAFGRTLNGIRVTVRAEGMDDFLRASLIEKLDVSKLMSRISEQPLELLKALESLASKVR